MIALLRRTLIRGISSYQRFLSPLLGPRCRYYPSCSQYARLCLENKKLPVAVLQTLGRLARCNPLFPGGVDYP